MKCIYCENDMIFNGENDRFSCKKCGAKLSLFQHPEMRTNDQLVKIEFENLNKPVGSENCNNDGIATQWFRGNI